MIAFGLIASFAVLGAICWVLFNLAVFALPFFAGVTAGMSLYHSGAAPLGAAAVGIVVGLATLLVGQLVLTLAPSTLVRVAVALLFAAPAAVAGYNATRGIIAVTISSEAWQQAFAILGAIVVGVTALARMMQPIPRPIARAVWDWLLGQVKRSSARERPARGDPGEASSSETAALTLALTRPRRAASSLASVGGQICYRALARIVLA